jgi:hypothetical protein
MRKSDNSMRELIDSIKNKLELNYSWNFYLIFKGSLQSLCFFKEICVFIMLISCYSVVYKLLIIGH